MITACVCTIGDEILIGQIVDTNSAYISKEMNRLGVKVERMLSIKDNEEDIIETLANCINNYNIIIVTGGLGPTKDDITKEALSKLSKSLSNTYNQDQLDIITSICTRRGIELSDLNRNQALVPENCIVIPNLKGTAPGMIFKFKKELDSDKETLLFSLPGVPYEMEFLMTEVSKTVVSNFSLGNIYHKTLVTFGIPESALAERIEKWEANLPKQVKLAYLPNPIVGVRLRLSIYSGDNQESHNIINKLTCDLKENLGLAIYGEGEDTLELVVSNLLRSNNKTLAIAESCTGGKISSLFTSLPGSSDIFKGSVIAYNNDVKKCLLNVNPVTLDKFGAVSEECVKEMALGVKSALGADYSIATSGIAGPNGGSDEKPVGTIWIAIAGKDFIEAKKIVFAGDRQRNIDRFSSEAINYLRLNLLSYH